MQSVIPSLHAVYLYAVFSYWVLNADHNDLKSYKNARRNPIGIVNLIKSKFLMGSSEVRRQQGQTVFAIIHNDMITVSQSLESSIYCQNSG